MHSEHASGFGLFILALLLAFPAGAEAQNLLWAKQTTGGATGHGIAVDGSGNSYITGDFSGSTTFGSGDPNQTTLKAAGSADIFIAKYDSQGALVWAKRAGGTEFDQGAGIAIDASGNIYVAGSFRSSATFGPGEANQTTLKSAGGSEIFVAKYGATGALVWAKRAGGVAFDRANGVVVDGAGNSYITGIFGLFASGAGTATFGAGEPNQTTLTSAGDHDIFVAKYNANGTLAWAKRAGGAGGVSGDSGDGGNGIGVDALGNSYVIGSFGLFGESGGTATFGAGEANQTTLNSAGEYDIYLAKYGTSGALIWAKRAGGTGRDIGSGITVDASGNSYVTGTFNGSATFGAGEINETMLTSAGNDDVFLAKYDATGTLLWARRAGGTEFSNGIAIAVDASANSFVTGAFSGSATFGSGEVNETTLASVPANEFDIFVAKYDPIGALVWVRRAGGPSVDPVSGIAVDALGNSFITGQFSGSATFGSGETNETTLMSANGDMFVAKFAAGNPLVNCPTQSLQTAVNAALPGQMILVSGACSENILVRNEKQRITIDGAGAGLGTRATITGSVSNPVFNVRGKGVLIQNLHITGGSHGVHVNRGSNAVLNNNIILSSSGNGVVVDELAFAVLINNAVEIHPGAGVFVSENSTARIGFNSDADEEASPNEIQNNAVGVVVSNGSSARIIGNTIHSANGDGVHVVRDSHADIASNVIAVNGNGIEVGENSSVQLGEDSGTSIYESPNLGGSTGFGIRCRNGGVIDGRLGDLSGDGGAKSTDAGCVDGVVP